MKLIYDFQEPITIDELINLSYEIESDIGMLPASIEVNEKRIAFSEIIKSPE